MDYNNLEQCLSLIRAKPENKHCADCNERNPSWASLSFGCLVCLRCSGIHRNMSTKITRIKSIELDVFQREWVELLDNIGNIKANNYWEKGLDKRKKPTPECDIRTLHDFIHTKYIKKRFINEYENDPVRLFLETPHHLRMKKTNSKRNYDALSLSNQTITTQNNISSKLNIDWGLSPKANSNYNFNFDFSKVQTGSTNSTQKDFLDFSDIDFVPKKSPTPIIEVKSPNNGLFDFDFISHNQKATHSYVPAVGNRTSPRNSSKLWENIPWDSLHQNNQNNIQIIPNNFQGAPVNVTINNIRNVNNYNYFGSAENTQKIAHKSSHDYGCFENPHVPSNGNFAKHSDAHNHFAEPQKLYINPSEENKKNHHATADFIMSLYKQTN